jgi:hypothetical protein
MYKPFYLRQILWHNYVKNIQEKMALNKSLETVYCLKRDQYKTQEE